MFLEVIKINNFLKEKGERESKFYGARYDTVFKNVIACENGKNILKAIIECALGMKLEEIILVPNELEKSSIESKGKTTDCIVKCDNMVINVEVNRVVDEGIRDRNARYIMTKHINQFKKNDDYTRVVHSVQINLDYNKEEDDYKKVYMFREENNKDDLFTNKIKIMTFNMAKLLEVWYNSDINNFEYKYLAMLAIDSKEKLEKLPMEDNIMEEYKNGVIDINNNDEFKDILTKEEENERVDRASLYYAHRDGFKEGIVSGIKQRNIEIAKNMLTKNMEITLISELTGLTTEEIEKLK